MIWKPAHTKYYNNKQHHLYYLQKIKNLKINLNLIIEKLLLLCMSVSLLKVYVHLSFRFDALHLYMGSFSNSSASPQFQTNPRVWTIYNIHYTSDIIFSVGLRVVYQPFQSLVVFFLYIFQHFDIIRYMIYLYYPAIQVIYCLSIIMDFIVYKLTFFNYTD